MAQWNGIVDHEWPPDPQYYPQSFYQESSQLFQPTQQTFFPPPAPTPPPTQPLFVTGPQGPPGILQNGFPLPKGDSPREIRNRAEKQRRDKLNQSIAELASLVPPVVAASRKIDKTGVLRLTAHYLRSHQYVFGDVINRGKSPEFSSRSSESLLRLLNGFLLTTTYKGIVVVVSQNVQQYLGYTELDLLGQNIFNITHEDDQKLLREQLMPKTSLLGPNGELLVPEEPEEKLKMEQSLANEKRKFLVRFKKLSQRSEPVQYLTCHIEGSLRKSDRACRGYSRSCQIVRRARARSDNPCSSGNDVVFIGIVRPSTETFMSEKEMESFKMEYRTRHSVDGQIIQCEQRISLVTGYMTQEVNGVNAMNFMHRDDVRWVIIALREMYDEHRLFGESCYRLMMKNGQFIYMKTRGCLEVDHKSRAVTSFVCTNTVVSEEEGIYLNKLMKKKFSMLVNHNSEPPAEDDFRDVSDQLPVEDPRNLEKVILHLVTNLPSPQPLESNREFSPDHSETYPHLAIIPPRKERILSAIKKIYSVIKNLKMEKKPKDNHDNNNKVLSRRLSPIPGRAREGQDLSLMIPSRPHSVSPTPRRLSPIPPLRHRVGLGHYNPDGDSLHASQENINLRRQIDGPVCRFGSNKELWSKDEQLNPESTSKNIEPVEQVELMSPMVQSKRVCPAICEVEGVPTETAVREALATPTPGCKRPNTALGSEGKNKVPKAGDSNISTTFASFIFDTLSDDHFSLLSKHPIETFPEMIESPDIDVEGLLQDIEKNQS